MSKDCLHCGLEVKDGGDFCCSGCKLAHKIINNLGFSSYYQNRIFKEGEKNLKPEEGNFVDVGDFILEEDKINNLHLMVEGLHCAACIWLIENILKKQDNVQKARINMSSHKLHLQWVGDKEEGNNLVKLINDLGYRLTPFDFEILKSEEKEYNSKLLKSLAVAGFAAGNVMLISVSLWSSTMEQMGIAMRNVLHLVSALIAVPAIIYSGRIFFFSAFKALKNKTTNMDVPISVAITLVCLTSIIETLNKAEHVYFDSAIMLTFFLLIGRYLDFSVRKKALDISSDLLLLSASTATILKEDGSSKIITSKNLQKDMVMLVASGQKILADGIIIKGKSDIDTSVITGESVACEKKVGDDVFAGMVNLANPIRVKITKSKDETLLSKIVSMISDFELEKGKYVKIADRFSKYYTPIVHILALITFLGWVLIMNQDWKTSLSYAIAVLIITCPCALALAVPVVQIIASTKLMKEKVLLKSGQALEIIDGIEKIVFDKTGTLTLGKPKMIFSSVKSDDLIFRIAASMSSQSSHPLSKALYNEYQGEILDLTIREIPGQGLLSSYQGKEIKMGKEEFVFRDNQQIIQFKQNSSNPEIYISYNDQIAHFLFEDLLRKDAQQTISQLHKMNKNIVLLSGDKKQVVEKVAQKLGIKEYYYQQDPIQKSSYLKSQKHPTIMIGDGINDAPALAAAAVSISPSSASDISKNSADIIFQGENLSPIISILKIAQKSKKIMKQNFLLALIYNLIAIPFAILGYVVPLFAALAMSSSSLIVILNSLRLRR